MKLKTLILLALVFTLFSFKSDKLKLNGTWKLVSQEYVRNGHHQMVIQDQLNGEQLKTWSDKYFMFVGKYVNGMQLQQSFGGGTYNLSGNVYSEDIQYHSSASLRGRTMTLYLELKGDTLLQIFPTDANGYYDKDNCNIEKYIRAD